MFESTLAAQGLGDGPRRIGALSAAVFAHVGIGLAVLTVTAVIVPKPHVPEPPDGPFTVILRPPLDDEPKPANPVPPPTKGNGAVRPGSSVVPPPVVPDVPPVATPDLLPTTEQDTAPEGPDTAGDGSEGDPNGSRDGVVGGTGDDASGTGVALRADPIEVTGDMKRPVLLVKVEPAYPEVARRAGLGGRVTLRAVIAEDGGVASVEVYASTNPLFNEAAVDAVRRWRYRPALMGGRPVRVYFSVVVDFLVR